MEEMVAGAQSKTLVHGLSQEHYSHVKGVNSYPTLHRNLLSKAEHAHIVSLMLDLITFEEKQKGGIRSGQNN